MGAEAPLVRDYLRANGGTRDAYLSAKLEAAERWRDDCVAYADAKTDVILRLRQDAETWARKVVWRARPS